MFERLGDFGGRRGLALLQTVTAWNDSSQNINYRKKPVPVWNRFLQAPSKIL
jgi:hypothetical protein